MTVRWIVVCLFFSSIVPGCAKDKKQDTMIDSLWRAGYGYNNPNRERQKQGLPPVNFDGSVQE